ncbi:MAG: polysaccharide export protein [Gammaproteobacteria bacterium]|nr:polysaccharide export protein [Gammaproteobacteria bacterium]
MVCTALMAGCALLPENGPSEGTIQRAGKKTGADRQFAMVQLDTTAVRELGARRIPLYNEQFSQTMSGKEGLLLGVGDQLAIGIWEASSDGLFSTVERKQNTIHAVIDQNGEIYIPYVGQIKVVGKSLEEVRATIEQGLQGKAVEPQVQVALQVNISNNVIVVGDIVKPGRYPVSVGGLRLLELVALAGGAKPPVYETEATIVRGDTRDTIRLDDILRKSENNVWLKPGDAVQIMHQPRSFTAFGAVTSQNRHTFKSEGISLAEALAEAGGLREALADAGGVFLFRFESPALLEQAGFEQPDVLVEGAAATVYRLDFDDPQAFFLAPSFAMQDKDMIFVSTAPAAEYFKFIQIFVNPLLNIGRTGIVISREFE